MTPLSNYLILSAMLFSIGAAGVFMRRNLITILLSIEALQAEFCDDKYRPCPLLKKMVAAGLHGHKSGQGFFTYPAA